MPPLHQCGTWKGAVEVIGVLILLLITLELFFDPLLDTLATRATLDLIELGLVSFITVDLILQLRCAPSAYVFVRHNVLKIISAIPFSLTFRSLRFLRFERYVGLVNVGEWLMNIGQLGGAINTLKIMLRVRSLWRRFRPH